MLKTRTYLLIAISIYVSVILINLPAVWVVRPFSENLEPDIEINNVHGSLWKGAVSGLVQQQSFSLNWDWELLHLLLLRLSFDLHLESSLVDAKGNFGVSPGGIRISELSGLVSHQALNALLLQEGINASIENDIYLRNLSVERDNARFVEGAGKASWEGGVLEAEDLPDGQAEFPGLTAKLSVVDQGLLLVLVPTENSEKHLLELILSHAGQAHLKLKERVSEYVTIPSQLLVGNPENVMFEIKRQVFETQGKF